MTVQQIFAAPFFFEVVLRSLRRAYLKSLNRDLIKLGSFIKKTASHISSQVKIRLRPLYLVLSATKLVSSG